MICGMIGLGKIGGNLSLQAMEKGHQVVGYSKSEEELNALAEKGLDPARSIQSLVEKLKSPRIVLLYVPSGDPTDEVCKELKQYLNSGDIVIDGGNSHWKKSVGRYEEFKEKRIHFLDCGTSGGVEGARKGACFMVGGDAVAYSIVEPLFKELAVPEGTLHVGPAGAGHFSKLIHNAIEFGMLQAIGEGVALVKYKN
jgi:6-phosphogluconate dehydrogenase